LNWKRLSPPIAELVCWQVQAAAAFREIEKLHRNREQVSVEGVPVLQSEATENSGTGRAGSVTSLSGFAAGFTMSGTGDTLPSGACRPRARGGVRTVRQVWDSKSDGIGRFFGTNSRAGVHSTFAESARKSQQTSHSSDFARCSIENREKTPLFALGSAPR